MRLANVGGLLRTARQNKELTLREVSEKVGVSVALVSDVELNRRDIPIARIPAFIKALQLDHKESASIYRALGVLPDDVVKRLLRTPEIWYADFEALVKHVTPAAPKKARGRKAKK